MFNVFGKQWSGRQRHLALLAVLVALKKAPRNLAYALRRNDDDFVRRLMTAQGDRALEHARRSKKLGWFPTGWKRARFV